MEAFTKLAKNRGSDGGAAAAQFLANKGGQEGLTQSITNSFSKGGLTGLIEKGKEAATDFQKISGQEQGAPPSVSDMLKQAPTGQGNLSAILQQAATGQIPPDLMKQAQAATVQQIPPDLMKQAQAATVQQIPPDLMKQAQAATVQKIPPDLSTVIQEAGTAVPTPPPSGKASAPTSVSNPSESESELKSKEAEKQTSKALTNAAESKAKEAEKKTSKAITNASNSADSDSRKIKELEKSKSDSEAKIKALEASLNEQKPKTAAEQAKTPLPPDGLKKKINDEYFNNLHLFFGKKHLVTLCETIDPFLKLEQHQEVVILPSELEKQNKITEILLALVRNMIYNFSRGDVISGGGTLDQLKKTIKKRISEIKPKFIS